MGRMEEEGRWVDQSPTETEVTKWRTAAGTVSLTNAVDSPDWICVAKRTFPIHAGDWMPCIP